MATYAIPEMNIESLEKKLTRIRNKAEKYGCEFKYERTGEHFEAVETDELDENGNRKKELIRYIDIEVEGKAEVNGWQFAATLDYTANGNIISGVEGLEIPERYYTCSPFCEHCKTRRDRKNSYIVYNTTTGEFKQVGRACLKDFTHGLSAEAVANYESWLKSCEEASEFSDMGGWGTHYYNVKDFMVAAAETIRLYGYVKRNDDGISCTADRANNLYRAWAGMPLGTLRDYIREQYDEAVTKGFDMEHEESKKLAETVREWILSNERNDNYFHNLKVACGSEYATGNMIGLLVSSFPAYNRELEYQAEKAERERKEQKAAAKSSWAGEVGEKISFKIADFTTISSWETQWGITYVYKFIDENGRECTWKTSNWLSEKCIGKTVKGTVKELKEFRGIKQTELTRCKVA
jgi:hypothetical protein